MRTLRHHTADSVVVRTLNHLVQPRESQALDHALLFDRGTNGGAHPLQVNLSAARIRFLCRHYFDPHLGTRYQVLGTLTVPAQSCPAWSRRPLESSTVSARRRSP